jgi:iron complex outermembrane receptor protein
MKFNNNRLSAAVALIISGGFISGSANVFAQSESLEEVVVTGIFQSVKTSMEKKRNSDVIADGIASEDLGKFPDQNVAESLQRITGVSIDRDGGEGRSVTVRGFGPEFNAVLYNGRALATEGEGRDFSFDILAADIISGADAYKTNTASILAGGIGATINLSTAKPMDQGGLRTAFTVKGTQDTLADATNPAVSGVVSWSDEVWGVLVSANHQERDYRRDSINMATPMALIKPLPILRLMVMVQFWRTYASRALWLWKPTAAPAPVIAARRLYNLNRPII